jgi:hypothetical protein
VFYARLEPRGCRGGIAPDTALLFREHSEGRYDQRVIAALRRPADSVTGEKLIADLGAAD